MSATPDILNLIANDIPGSLPIDPTSVVLSNIDPTLSVINNGDGTVTVTGIEIGVKTFDYTVANTNGDVSNVTTVNYLVKPCPVLPNTVGGLVEHLRGEDLTDGDGAQLTTWTAAVGNSATNTSGAVTVDADGVNGLPAVDFSGATPNDGIVLGDPYGAPFTDFTWMVVYQQDGTGDQETLLSPIQNGASVNFFLSHDAGSTNIAGIFNVNIPGADSFAPKPPSNLPVILTGRYDGATLSSWFNLAANTDDAVVAGPFNNDPFRVGGSGFFTQGNFHGRIAEVVMYSQALTDVDTLNVIEGLKQKYSIL